MQLQTLEKPTPTIWRTDVCEGDIDAVRALVEATAFFNAQETDIAAGLVAETLDPGSESDYRFVFVDAPDDTDRLLGYACFGPIPLTRSSFDLYWIAVVPDQQNKGLGAQLLEQTEHLAREQGASRIYADTSGRLQYTPTRAFYERMGYEKVAVFADFYAPGDDKVVYGKKLG